MGKTLGRCPETTFPRAELSPGSPPHAGHASTMPRYHGELFFESCNLYITLQILALSPFLLSTGDAGGNCHGTHPCPTIPRPQLHSLQPPHKHDPSPGPGRPPAASSSELY